MRSMKFSPRLAIEPQTISVVVRRDNLCTTGSLARARIHISREQFETFKVEYSMFLYFHERFWDFPVVSYTASK